MTLSDLDGDLDGRFSYLCACVRVCLSQDVVRAAFGRSGFVVLTFMQFLYPFIGKHIRTTRRSFLYIFRAVTPLLGLDAVYGCPGCTQRRLIRRLTRSWERLTEAFNDV